MAFFVLKMMMKIKNYIGVFRVFFTFRTLKNPPCISQTFCHGLVVLSILRVKSQTRLKDIGTPLNFPCRETISPPLSNCLLCLLLYYFSLSLTVKDIHNNTIFKSKRYTWNNHHLGY